MEPQPITAEEEQTAIRGAPHPAHGSHQQQPGDDWSEGNHTSDQELDQMTVKYVPAEDGGSAPVVP
jgi:hypothetical protein